MKRQRFLLLGLVFGLGLTTFRLVPTNKEQTGKERESLPVLFAFRDDSAGGKYGFINRQGAIVVEPKYLYALDSSNGLAEVEWDNKIGFLDGHGALKFTLPPDASRAGRFSEGLVWFQRKNSSRWGLCNGQGVVVLEPKYDAVEAFSEGLAAVMTGAQWWHPRVAGGKWGYVDRKGKIVIPARYEYAYDFSGGLARVSDSEDEKFIDRSGNVVITVKDGSAGDFREGLASILIGDRTKDGKDWLTRFIDPLGRTVFTVAGHAEEFHEGLAVFSVKTNGESKDRRFGYVDKMGTVAIPPTFAEAFDFSEGLAAVQTKKTSVRGKDDTWGYIDKNGRLRIDPHFNDLGSFRGGVAKAHVGGRFAIVTDAPPYWEGGEWWLIDTKGKRLKRIQ